MRFVLTCSFPFPSRFTLLHCPPCSHTNTPMGCAGACPGSLVQCRGEGTPEVPWSGDKPSAWGWERWAPAMATSMSPEAHGACLVALRGRLVTAAPVPPALRLSQWLLSGPSCHHRDLPCPLPHRPGAASWGVLHPQTLNGGVLGQLPQGLHCLLHHSFVCERPGCREGVARASSHCPDKCPSGKPIASKREHPSACSATGALPAAAHVTGGLRRAPHKGLLGTQTTKSICCGSNNPQLRAGWPCQAHTEVMQPEMETERQRQHRRQQCWLVRQQRRAGRTQPQGRSSSSSTHRQQSPLQPQPQPCCVSSPLPGQDVRQGGHDTSQNGCLVCHNMAAGRAVLRALAHGRTMSGTPHRVRSHVSPAPWAHLPSPMALDQLQGAGLEPRA